MFTIARTCYILLPTTQCNKTNNTKFIPVLRTFIIQSTGITKPLYAQVRYLYTQILESKGQPCNESYCSVILSHACIKLQGKTANTLCIEGICNMNHVVYSNQIY